MLDRPLGVLLLCAILPLACNDAPNAAPAQVPARQWSLASNMAPMFEDPETEPQPPGSPIYPNPGVLGCSSMFFCGCDEAQVVCGDEWATRGCVIEIPDDACRRLGHLPSSATRPGAPVAEIDPECVLDPAAPPPVLDELDSIMAYCGLQHESTHACDPEDAEISCSERNAYGNSGICLRGFYDRQCAGADPMPSYCDMLDLHGDAQDGFGALEACLCDGNRDCWACIAACEATGLATQHCESFGFQSCAREDISVPDRPPPPVTETDVEPMAWD